MRRRGEEMLQFNYGSKEERKDCAPKADRKANVIQKCKGDLL
jgi:hypothetical protein